MKKIFSPLILFIFVASNILNAQAPDWEWAKRAGGTNDDFAYGIATDASGNSYISGFYRSPEVIFGNDTLRNSIQNGGSFFIAKYDPLGNILWAQNPGTDNLTEDTRLKIDIQDNCYLISTAEYSIVDFGPFHLTVSGNENILVAKFNPAGNIDWAKTYGATYYDYGFRIANDENGNLYINGNFGSPEIIFGNDTIKNTANGNQQIYIAKLDSAGNAIWGKSANGSENDIVGGLAVDKSGNSYITGSFYSPVLTFDRDTLANNSNSAFAICFFAKYDPSGNVRWAKSPAGGKYSSGGQIATDNEGNFYLIGDFSDIAIFGKDTLNGEQGRYSIYIAKFDTSGNPIWAFNSTEYDPVGNNYFSGITVQANGNVLITGNFISNEIIFGKDTLTNSDSGSTHLFVMEIDPSGKILWTKSAGGVLADYSFGAGSDMYGNCYIAGQFSSREINFGADTLINAASVTSTDNNNIFIAKIDNSIATSVEPINYARNSITVFPNPSTGQFYFKGVGEGSTIEIYNVLGQTIYSSLVNSDNYQVNLSGAAKGIYIYTVKSKAETAQQGKIVIE